MNIYNTRKGSVYVSVIEGEIELTASYNGASSNWQVKSGGETKELSFDFIKDGENYDWRPTVFKAISIGSIPRSVFSLHVARDDNP